MRSHHPFLTAENNQKIRLNYARLGFLEAVMRQY